MSLPSTRTLEAFVVAARLGSLAAAGTRLGLSVPALSRRLSALEEELGVRLLDRLPRGVVPTPAGNAYLIHAVAALDRLRAAADELRHGATMVRVTTIAALATRWLLPRLPDFTDRHPDIEVDVRTSIEFERLEASGFDYALRLALDAEMPNAPLLPIYIMPVWSGARPLPIERPADILSYPLLGPDHRPEFWDEWLDASRLSPTQAQRRDVDALLLYERAVSGTGVAIGIEPLVSDLLQQGRLHGLGTHRMRSARSFFLLTNAKPPPRAARVFGQWLKRQAHQAEPPIARSMAASIRCGH
jgi:LysR family glycine cleavage system transcriptional activator